MSPPKSIDVESLIAQTRAGLEHPIPPPWPDAKKVMAFLCDAMEAMVGEVRASRAAESSLKSRLAAAEARAERAVGMLRDARDILEAHPRRTQRGGWMEQPILQRIAALLKEVSHGQQG